MRTSLRHYNRERAIVNRLKEKKRARRRRIREWCHVSTIAILQLVIVALLIAFYAVFAMSVMAKDTVKVGDGAFVMAVSYTESYDDLQYVANFSDCDKALDYYNQNCTNAYIMMCQLEAKLYMPIGHETRNTFSTFDFEIDTAQSCGFVGVQKPKFIEE
tara:strand:- start:187 stop:663 length:477 start_codon:yes stop_codon:yes gene_type:complete